MNGRVFDPLVGRFLSADPNIQTVDDLQSYNRYSYVLNNPVSAIDPTGYWSIGSVLGDIGTMLDGLVRWNIQTNPIGRWSTQYLYSHQWAYALANYLAAAATMSSCGGCGSGALDFVVTAGGSGSFTQALRAGALSYSEGLADDWIGGHSHGLFNTALHATAGCASAAASGGKCGAGALSGGFSALTLNYGGGRFEDPVSQVIIGGTTSMLGGGTFANGAMTASFGYLENWLSHVHYRITLEAALGVGMSNADAIRLAALVRDVDLLNDDNSYGHIWNADSQKPDHSEPPR